MNDPTPTQGTLPAPLTAAELTEMRAVAEHLASYNNVYTENGRSYMRLLDEHAALKAAVRAVDEFRTSDLTSTLVSYGIDEDDAEDAADDIDSELYGALAGARHLLAVRK